MINNCHLCWFCSISSDGAGHVLIDQMIALAAKNRVEDLERGNPTSRPFSHQIVERERAAEGGELQQQLQKLSSSQNCDRPETFSFKRRFYLCPQQAAAEQHVGVFRGFFCL
jgi:hypothetical protein